MSISHWIRCAYDAGFNLSELGAILFLANCALNKHPYFTTPNMTIKELCNDRHMRYQSFMQTLPRLIAFGFISVELVNGIKRITLLNRDHISLTT